MRACAPATWQAAGGSAQHFAALNWLAACLYSSSASSYLLPPKKLESMDLSLASAFLMISWAFSSALDMGPEGASMGGGGGGGGIDILSAARCSAAFAPWQAAFLYRAHPQVWRLCLERHLLHEPLSEEFPASL